jgi:CheY-like chemotaxis protein
MSDRELLRRLSRPTKVSILAVEARAGTLSSSDLAGLLDILSAGPTERTGLARAAIETCAAEGMPGGRLADLRVAWGVTDSVRLPAARPPAPAAAPVAGRPRSSVMDTRAVKLAFRTQFEDAMAVSQAKARAASGAGPGASAEGLRRVLVADEDQSARAAFRTELQDAGFYVFEARDGREAWQRLETPGIDALVMEMKLSGISGLELLAKLNAAGRALPVVVCTTMLDVQGEFGVATYPRLCFLAKPVPARALAEALNALLASTS